MRESHHLRRLDLALDAEVSARHISFSKPTVRSRAATCCGCSPMCWYIPLRERNFLLTAANYAPIYGETSLNETRMTRVGCRGDGASLTSMRRTI